MKMYTQFEKQYVDFLREHLQSIDTTVVKSSEHSAVEYIRNFTREHGIRLTPNINKSLKCDDLARSHYHYGHELHRNAPHVCLRELNEGVRMALDGETLLRIILLRINVLMTLKLCQEAKKDLRFLQLLYPDTTFLKTRNFQKDSTYTPMKNDKNSNDECTEAFSEFHKVFNLYPQSNLEEKLLSELEDAFQCIEQLELSNGNSHNNSNLHRGANTEAPYPYSNNHLEGYTNISPDVKIVHTTEKGRHAIARQDINIGDVIGVECPVVYTVLHEKWLRYCQHCLCNARAPIPCPHCPDVVYCSAVCWYKDNPEHSIICGFMSEISSLPAMTYLALRTALTFRDSIMDLNNNFPECTSDNINFKRTISLVTNFNLRAPIDVVRRSCLALFLTNFLKTMKLVHHVPQIKGFEKEFYEKCGYLLFLVLQSFPCNAHEISELQLCEEFRYSANEDIGAGAFVFLSMLNHSCNPNVVRHSAGNKTVLRALRRIESGAELLDNYGYHYATHSLADRRKYLKSQYLFECQCDPCTKAWPMFMNLPSTPMLKCKYCGIKTSSMIVTCRKCGKKTGKALQTYSRQAADIQGVVQQYVSGNARDSKDTNVIKFLQFCEAWTLPPYRLYNECQEVLKQMWNLRSNVFDAITDMD